MGGKGGWIILTLDKSMQAACLFPRENATNGATAYVCAEENSIGMPGRLNILPQQKDSSFWCR